jgi:hypothetical protein
VPVKSKVKISNNFVAFSEYMNFIMGSLGGSPSDYNKLEENKNVHHYFDTIENTVDISQLNDMSFGEETHSINETTGSMPQIHGKCRSSWLF